MAQANQPASIAGREMPFFHTCAFFRSREEEVRIMSPFLAEGLTAGEKAVYIVNPEIKHDHARCLAEAGVPVNENPGALDVLDWNETYLRDGSFDKALMLEAVQATIDAGEAAGYPRSRIVGQMSWAAEGAPGSEQLLDYEVDVNEILALRRQPAVCVYYTDELSANEMMDLLRVHPACIVGGTLYENPFYTPAEEMRDELRARRLNAE